MLIFYFNNFMHAHADFMYSFLYCYNKQKNEIPILGFLSVKCRNWFYERIKFENPFFKKLILV